MDHWCYIHLFNVLAVYAARGVLQCKLDYRRSLLVKRTMEMEVSTLQY